MRICDRCKEPATDRVKFERDEDTRDVCDACRKQVRDMLYTPLKRPRRGKSTD